MVYKWYILPIGGIIWYLPPIEGTRKLHWFFWCSSYSFLLLRSINHVCLSRFWFWSGPRSGIYCTETISCALCWAVCHIVFFDKCLGAKLDLWTFFFFGGGGAGAGGGEIISIQLVFSWFMLIWKYVVTHYVYTMSIMSSIDTSSQKCIWHCLIFLEKNCCAVFLGVFYPAHNSRGFQAKHAMPFWKNRSPQCQCSCDACCCRCCWIKMVQVTGVPSNFKNNHWFVERSFQNIFKTLII